MFLLIVQGIFDVLLGFGQSVIKNVTTRIHAINEMKVIYFTRGDDAVTLNKAALYVMENEQTSHMLVVHLFDAQEKIPEGLAEQLTTIDHLYPKLRIDFLAVKGSFTPSMIEALSVRLGVPKNNMFIGTPGDHFPHRVEKLGGVRLIL